MTLAAYPTIPQLVSEIEEAYYRGDMPVIERVVLIYRGTPYEHRILGHARIRLILPELRAAYCAYETLDERTLRAKLLQDPGCVAGSVPVARTFAYVPIEAAAAGIGDNAHYCHIGSGPLPETLLAMRAVAPRASLTGIDADSDALQLGREFVRAVAPRSAISFLHAAGDTVDYRGFTHIHVAVLVRPEHQVVRCVCETADPQVTIMLRTAEGLGSLLYEPILAETEKLLQGQGFRQVRTVRGHAIMSTAIFTREAS